MSAYPTVIGTGITGLAISRALSAAGITHVLIGKPPTETPRLGESLDTTATLDLLESFPEFSRFYHQKSEIEFLLGERSVTCDLRFAEKWYVTTPLRLSRVATPQFLLHVDRVGLDCELFKSVIESPQCRFVDALVETVDYDAKTDKIGQVHLSTGGVVAPSHVFDATFVKGPVPAAVHLSCQALSTLQLVGFAHYRPSDRRHGDREEWEQRTTLLRLMSATDGMDGFAWCIPVGDTLSVGITTEAESCDYPAEELIRLTEEAYSRRGLEYTKRFGQRTSLTTVRHKYFMQERVTGANWMLAGPSACQVWYMSGAGVGMGLAAARIAPRFMKNPRRYGRLYQDYVRGLEKSHRILEELRYSDTASADVATLHKLFDRLIHSNVKRTARYFRLRGNRMGAFWTEFSYQMCLAKIALHNYCNISPQFTISSHPPTDQQPVWPIPRS